MLNRTVPPELTTITHIDFVAPQTIALNESAKLFHMKNVPNETVRFELYFDAGKCKTDNGTPVFVNGLLLSGTDEKSSVEISNAINSLGGFLETGISAENAVISMYCLRENFEDLFGILIDAIKNVAFIEKEVDEFLSDRKQQLNINMKKVGYLAQRGFQEKIFASNPDYNTPLNHSDFDAVSIDQLKEFHREHYLNGLDHIVVVGDLENEVIERISEQAKPLLNKREPAFDDTLLHEKGKKHIEKKDALQSALRIGRILFNKKHEDYLDFLVLNTILGDYFGSRLMSNIREDKGYTYGIGSLMAELNETGYFLIAAEVGKPVLEATLKEIQHELKRLQDELVGTDELELVKNYMRGQLLKSADGPYAMTDLFLSAEIHGKTLEFYNQALERINAITPERIRELAQKYLNWEDMAIVTAG